MAFGVGHILFLTSPIGPTRKIMQSLVHLAVFEILWPSVMPLLNTTTDFAYLGGHHSIPG